MILLTGGTGFIGSATLWMLNQKGRGDIVLADNLGVEQKWRNLIGRGFADFVHYDHLFEYLKLREKALKIETVIHMGASTDTTATDMDALYRNNTEFTRRLFLWAKAASARFIYASASAVYGDGSAGFSDDDETTLKLKPLSAYGFSKWLFENWLVRTGQANEAVGLRLFNIYGPNEYHKGRAASMLYRAVAECRTRWGIRLFQATRGDCKDGEQRRDFMYVKDVLKVIEFFLENPGIGGIYNVGTGEARSFNDLADAIGKAIRKPLQVEYFPIPQELRKQYQQYTQADLTRLRQAGFRGTFMPFYQAVADYVQNYLAKGDTTL